MLPQSPAPTRSSPSVPAPTSLGDHGPWLDLLTGDAAADVLGAALAADGAELETWSVRQVHARPGAEVTVAYDVVARREVGGSTVRGPEHLFATSAGASAFRRARGGGDATLGPGVVRLDDGERAVHVWRHPHDPALPGLAAGSTPDRVAERMQAAGVASPTLSLETVTYRPLRRAVLRARTADGATYVKVVRPARVDDLVRRHALFAARPGGVAAPRVRSWSADGVLLLDEVPGESVAEHVARTPAADQPACVDPAELLRVVAALPRAGLALPRRPAWADRLDHYLGALAGVRGVDGDRLARLREAIVAVVNAGDLGPLVVTHGDLHAANLLLEPGSGRTDEGDRTPPRVGAVLDVDTLGPGHLVDDLACAVAHLAVLPHLDPGAYAGVDGLVERWLDVLGRAVGPALLRARAAAVVVSLATGAESDAAVEGFLHVAERLAAEASAV
ncbi:phosphotransferase family protein [Isoptericola sp. NPDC019693]|uniref:phosphotransferase family protein n=1 Tax=Isoptericola sp. NPDC019693 TaxID=3364009 RepID=UPI0037A561F4